MVTSCTPGSCWIMTARQAHSIHCACTGQACSKLRHPCSGDQLPFSGDRQNSPIEMQTECFHDMHPELTNVIAVNGEVAKRSAGFPGDASNNSNFSSVSTNQLDPSIQRDKKMTFNIGGVKFQTLQATIKDVAKLNEEVLEAHFDVDNNEFFFDRDPEVFRSILNYWRTGKLHLPLFRCGPSIREELEFWGLEELDIEPCCWNNYNIGIATTASLAKLRRDSMKEKESKFIQEPTTRIGHWRLHVWYLLTSPSYSKLAKIYENIAVFFALLAIFSMCASTTAFFQIPIQAKPNPDKNQNETRLMVERSAITQHEPHKGPKKNVNYRVSPVLKIIDYICLCVFTAEYLSCLFCTNKQLRFILSTSAIIDVLAILPDYIEIVLQKLYPQTEHESVLSVLTLLRLMRVVRILRVIRRVPGLCIMFFTLRASHKELFLMLLFMLVGTLLFGSAIHYVDDDTVFTSIPSSFWWAIVTMTTVGYGDMVPKSAWGQIVGSMTAVCGVLLIAFSIPSLVNNFLCYSVLIQYDANQKSLPPKKLSLPDKVSLIRVNGDRSSPPSCSEA